MEEFPARHVWLPKGTPMSCFYTNRSTGFSWLNGMRCCFSLFFRHQNPSLYTVYHRIPMFCRHSPPAFVVGRRILFIFSSFLPRSLSTKIVAESLGIRLSHGIPMDYTIPRIFSGALEGMPHLQIIFLSTSLCFSRFLVFSSPRQQLLVSGVRLWGAQCDQLTIWRVSTVSPGKQT